LKEQVVFNKSNTSRNKSSIIRYITAEIEKIFPFGKYDLIEDQIKSRKPLLLIKMTFDEFLIGFNDYRELCKEHYKELRYGQCLMNYLTMHCHRVEENLPKEYDVFAYDSEVIVDKTLNYLMKHWNELNGSVTLRKLS
jgi:hypothetical protein